MNEPATEQVVVPAKTRGWFRRWGWMLALLALLLIAWVAWSFFATDDSAIALKELEEDRHCEVNTTIPDWLWSVVNSAWCPDRMATWLRNRFSYPVLISVEAKLDQAHAERLMERISSASWPTVLVLGTYQIPLWNGSRLLLPMKCPRLVEIRAYGAGMDDEALKQITQRYPNLQRLFLSDNPIQGYTLDTLKRLPQLTMLGLAATQINDETIQRLPLLPQLHALELQETSIGRVELFQQGVPAKLNRLRLTKTMVSWKSLTRLRNHQCLEFLELDQTPLTDDGMELVGTLAKLRQLHLSETQVSDIGIAWLKSASRLDFLLLSKTRISSASGKTIACMSQLGFLDVSDTAVDDNFITALRNHPGIHTFCLSGTKVGDKALSNLLTLPQLNELEIHQGQFSEASVKQLEARQVHVDIIEPRGILK